MEILSTSHSKSSQKYRGQAIVEFVIALPILLFILFGLIEFARLTFAWMAVQNAARFGIRYAVTGEFNDIYCVPAGAQLGATHVNADVFGGDPQDCLVPDAFPGLNGNDLEQGLDRPGPIVFDPGCCGGRWERPVDRTCSIRGL